MDTKMERAVLPLRESARPEKAERIVRRIFRDYPGSMAVRMVDGGMLSFGAGAPAFSLVFKSPSVLRDLILSPGPLKFADAYFRDWADIEGDIYAVLGLRAYLDKLGIPLAEKIALWFSALTMGRGWGAANRDGSRTWSNTLPRHSRDMNREAIGFHYDVSNDFYRLWLDARMLYSCAYFEQMGDTLEQAQMNKLDLICRKLRLKPGERLLDIGCGWGALVIWAAKHYGVHAHGVTLSRNQHAFAQQRIREEGLEHRITVELRDYRDIEGRDLYDKISSVGMFEHVGLKNLPVYFAVAHRLLKPGGLFLNHGITQDVEGGTGSIGAAFIARYVFPDGELDRVSNIQRGMEQGGFEICDVESMRRHYALTLRHWVARLERRHEEALRHVSEAVYRIWRMYMAGCALQFENGELGIYQILAAKRTGAPLDLRLTREYIVRKTSHAHEQPERMIPANVRYLAI